MKTGIQGGAVLLLVTSALVIAGRNLEAEAHLQGSKPLKKGPHSGDLKKAADLLSALEMMEKSYFYDVNDDAGMGNIENDFSDNVSIDRDAQKDIFRPRQIRKVLPFTRLRRLDNNNNEYEDHNSAGRVTRDSLPVIRLKKDPEVVQLYNEGVNKEYSSAPNDLVKFDGGNVWQHRQHSPHIIPMISEDQAKLSQIRGRQTRGLPLPFTRL